MAYTNSTDVTLDSESTLKSHRGPNNMSRFSLMFRSLNNYCAMMSMRLMQYIRLSGAQVIGNPLLMVFFASHHFLCRIRASFHLD